MKTAYKIIKSLAGKICLSLTIGLALMATAVRAQNATGTYVTPRPYVLWSGTLTNGQTVTPANLTNFLNYSGFHRLGLQLTLVSTNAGVGTSNVVTTVNVSGGNGNGYTNSVLGTNLVFTTTGPLAANSYVVSGTTSDTYGNQGTYSFTLVVTPVTIVQGDPISGTVTTTGSAGFTDQLTTSSGSIGTVTYSAGTSTPAGVDVSTSGAVSTTGALAANSYVVTGTTTET